MPQAQDAGSGRGVNRRQLLLGGAAAGLGAAAAIGADFALASRDRASSTSAADADAITRSDAVPFHGPHQAGVATVPQAHTAFIGLDLAPSTSQDGLRRMYGENVTRNAVHASDSVENARMAASRFIREEDIVVARSEPKEE